MNWSIVLTVSILFCIFSSVPAEPKPIYERERAGYLWSENHPLTDPVDHAKLPSVKSARETIKKWLEIQADAKAIENNKWAQDGKPSKSRALMSGAGRLSVLDEGVYYHYWKNYLPLRGGEILGKPVADGKCLRFMVQLDCAKPEELNVNDQWYQVTVDVHQGKDEPEVVAIVPGGF